MAKKLTNKVWIIGSVALVDVSTRRHPRAVAMVDIADLPRLEIGTGGRWAASLGKRTLYAMRNIARDGRRTRESLHRLLLPEAEEVDHRHHDGLDNRRAEIRLATRMQNGRNLRPRRNKVGFKGISRRGDKWRAFIWAGGREVSLGSFLSAEDAARAYDAAARLHFGEFARTNFPGIRQ